MHGCSSTSVLLVNAEFDSMGGVVEGGVGIVNKNSPRRAAIEKVQAELRQEYEIREKRNRELAFLEEGGDPMEYYKIGSAASVSVHSTSFTDQLVTSEAKGSIAFTPSPHGDSVESSGRLGEKPFEPNGADNLVLFDAEHEFSEADRNSLHASRSNMMPSEKLSQVGVHRTHEHGDSAAFGVPKKAYKRRNRSRPNRDGTRSSSTDVNPTRAIHGSSLPSRHDLRDASIDCNSKPTSPVDGAVQKTGLTDSQQDMELDGRKTVEPTKDPIDSIPVNATSDLIASEIPLHDQHEKQSHPGAVKTPIQIDSDGPKAVQAIEEITSAVVEGQCSANAIEVENHCTSCQMNGFSNKKVDAMEDGVCNTSASCGIKGLDSENSCKQTSLCIDGNNDSELHTKIRNADSKAMNYDESLVPDGPTVLKGDEFVKDKKETEGLGSSTIVNAISSSAGQSQRDNGLKPHVDDELNQSGAALNNEVKDQSVIEGTEASGRDGSESGRKPSDNCRIHNVNSSNVRQQGSIGISISEAQNPSVADLSLARKIDEDSILKEAQIIEAKRKRIAELSFATSLQQIHPKSHWNYVLEEMAWLANDFAQERIWKIAAAAQMSSRAAFTCQLRKKEKSSGMEAKIVARNLAKAVMEFWHSVEETSNVLEQKSQREDTHSVQAYATRFLKYSNSNIVHNLAEGPVSPDRVSDMGILDLSWGDNMKEEHLFYTIPPGAMQTYKNLIESHVAKFERIGSRVQEDVETSACDVSASFESEDNTDGETNTYDMPRSGEKNRKQLISAYAVRSCKVSSDMLQMQSAENKVATQSVLAKRPGGSLNVSIPTKRVRTASRRVISPFSAGTPGCIQVPIKTDASSGDTNSFQDDQSTLRGGSLVPHGLEVESVGAFEKQLPFDSAEVSAKHKKKKTAKHLNAAYEPRWQVDSTFQNEQFQRDHLNSHQLESNGGSGLLGQPVTKKPKIMRQSQDNSFENITPITGSIPSPVVFQMSNMSNPNKFIKMLGGRDRGRKPQLLKMPAEQPESESSWTLYEDQALAVLAHDLGPNWELVSDAINSTLKFKSIFRKPKECKERHSCLKERTSGDGADSAEDFGSSQPDTPTLPGIPKGHARRLFKRLQGPMEEDTLKSHFEKIITMVQKQHCRKNPDPKPLLQLDDSHTIALSQVCPNNLNGGHVLTPLDLCDATMAGHDLLSPGYQGLHSGALTIPNHGVATPMQHASGACSVLQGSPNMMLVNNFSSSPNSLNSSVRDGRYGVPRSASLSADEQQRMQQYSQNQPGRNIPQPNVSGPGALPATERGVRMLPSGNSMGLGSGVNRSMPIARPGFHGISSPSLVNAGSMGSPVMSPANMHSGVGSGQATMLRPRESLHMARPGPSQDSQKQMMVPDLQMQVSPLNSQVSHFGGSSSPLPNSPVTPYPLHHHQQSHPVSPQQPQLPSPRHPHFQGPANHAPNPQQQYAIRLAKERQQQQRFLQQQQQQQYGASSSMPHIQSQPQPHISSPVQSSSTLQPQANSSPASHSPLTSSMNTTPQNQQKPQAPAQGVVRNAQPGGSGLTNQGGKQRQKQQQQLSQANRQHPQKRQQPQAAQQPTKLAKGVGRGNQKIPIDPSLVNGVSTNPGNQFSTKEAATNSMQNQGLYTGSAQPTRQHVSSQASNQSMPQHKVNSASSTKHTHQMTHSDNNIQGSGHQSVSNHQHALSHQKFVNKKQLPLQRVAPSNHQINSDPSNKPQVRDSNSDQQPTTSSAEMDTMAKLPQPTSNTTTAVQPVSPASAPEWHASEPLFNPKTINPAANLSPLVSLPNSSESSPKGGQGRGQRLSSASVPSNVSEQWHNQPSQLQNPNSPVPQQHQQLLPPPHPQQQAQLLQAGSGNLYSRPTEHRLE